MIESIKLWDECCLGHQSCTGVKTSILSFIELIVNEFWEIDSRSFWRVIFFLTSLFFCFRCHPPVISFLQLVIKDYETSSKTNHFWEYIIMTFDPFMIWNFLLCCLFNLKFKLKLYFLWMNTFFVGIKSIKVCLVNLLFKINHKCVIVHIFSSRFVRIYTLYICRYVIS